MTSGEVFLMSKESESNRNEFRKRVTEANKRLSSEVKTELMSKMVTSGEVFLMSKGSESNRNEFRKRVTEANKRLSSEVKTELMSKMVTSGEVFLMSKGSESNRNKFRKRVTEQLKLLWHNRNKWGYSSVGRATGSQSVGREFDPPYLHH